MARNEMTNYLYSLLEPLNGKPDLFGIVEADFVKSTTDSFARKWQVGDIFNYLYIFEPEVQIRTKTNKRIRRPTNEIEDDNLRIVFVSKNYFNREPHKITFGILDEELFMSLDEAKPNNHARFVSFKTDMVNNCHDDVILMMMMRAAYWTLKR